MVSLATYKYSACQDRTLSDSISVIKNICINFVRSKVWTNRNVRKTFCFTKLSNNFCLLKGSKMPLLFLWTYYYTNIAYSIYWCLEQVSATYRPRTGTGPPSKIIRLVAPLPNCSICVARFFVLHCMNLASLQLLVLYTYEQILMRNRTVW